MIQDLKRLGSLFDRRDRWRFVGMMGLLFVGSLMEMAGVGAIPMFVATLAVPDRIREHPWGEAALDWLGITTNQELVVYGAAGLTLLFLLKNIFLSAITYVQIRMVEHYRVQLADRLFRAYMHAPYEFHLGRNTAELLRNVNQETKEIVQGIVAPLIKMCMALLISILVVGLILVTTPLITLLGVGFVGGATWLFMWIFRGRLQRLGREAKQERYVSIQSINQGLGGIQETRVLGREPYFIRAFYRSIAHYAKTNRFRQFTVSLSNPVLEFISVAGMMAIVLLIGLSGTDLRALVPTLTLFGVAILRLRSQVNTLTGAVTQMRYSMPAIDSVFDDLVLLQGSVKGRPPKRKRKPARSAAEETADLTLRTALRLQNVTYTYPGVQVPALQGIDLIIEKGTAVGFVGSTGAGKTTLINVLLGLLRPQEGAILVDDVDIHRDIGAWQRQVGYVPQTIFLIDGTIRSNVAYGLEDDEVDDERLWHAIRAAQLEEFVTSLDLGVETLVGERGVRISGGQRQRIGLARALYHDPSILVMDEATSSLDNQTESLVMEALERRKRERTFIIIAHRLRTVRNCDRLYFLKDGRVEASGTYDELCEQHVEFRRMAEIA